jgi:ribonuclease HII
MRHIAGLDEAGRGPLAGPVVAAAVILPQGERYEGLTDSKQLRPAKREYWYDRVRACALDYAIAAVDEREIDKRNILVASRRAMEKALHGLSLRPDVLLIDGIVPLETKVTQQCIKKGDQRSQSVAAASVLAKVTRDRLMEGYHIQYPHYNFRKNKGYGSREHLEALRIHGICPIHRRSFRGVRELLTCEKEPRSTALFPQGQTF